MDESPRHDETVEDLVAVKLKRKTQMMQIVLCEEKYIDVIFRGVSTLGKRVIMEGNMVSPFLRFVDGIQPQLGSLA